MKGICQLLARIIESLRSRAHIRQLLELPEVDLRASGHAKVRLEWYVLVWLSKKQRGRLVGVSEAFRPKSYGWIPKHELCACIAYRVIFHKTTLWDSWDRRHRPEALALECHIELWLLPLKVLINQARQSI